MPGASWFPGAQVNYAQQVLRHADAAHAAGHPAIVFQRRARHAARGAARDRAGPSCAARSPSLALQLQALGVQRGRPRRGLPAEHAARPWSPSSPAPASARSGRCARPTWAPIAVLDRFRQIEPKVLIAVRRLRATAARRTTARAVRARSCSPRCRRVRDAGAASTAAGAARASTGRARAAHDFARARRRRRAPSSRAWLPFDHPLWIVYSSGTTGLPKPIVHGHGGVMLEALKAGPAQRPRAERRHRRPLPLVQLDRLDHVELAARRAARRHAPSASSTAAPAAQAGAPDWAHAVALRRAPRASTFFGAGAAFFASCLKAGVEPLRAATCRALRALGSTGSPLADECYAGSAQRLPKAGGERHLARPDLRRHRLRRRLPRRHARPCRWCRGEMQCRCLGAAVEAWRADASGAAGHFDEVGELVCTEPMPSMPLYFWNDAGRPARYRDSYFDMYPRRLAPWRLAAHHAARRRHHLRPQRRDHQPPRHPHGHGRAVPRGRGAARGARQPRRRPRIPRPRELHAALRGAARRASCSTRR